MTKQRMRIKQTTSLEQRLAEHAERLRKQAKNVPLGSERKQLLSLIHQCEVASHMIDWLQSPGCHPSQD
jgi:hypothetical protein